MSLILSRYECAECGRRHANGSKAQARCEKQRTDIEDHHAAHPCAVCREWPGWTDARCEACQTSPKARAEEARNRHWSGNITKQTPKGVPSGNGAGVNP